MALQKQDRPIDKKNDQGDFLENHPELDTFCLFLGYPKSGHSLIGAVLDAHPEIIISHELNVLKCIGIGLSQGQICRSILKNSRLYAKKGRKWRGYSYKVHNQWNGRCKTLKVIGDKKGGGTTRLLDKDFSLFKRFEQTIALKRKYIHVIRNPFDSISTLSKMTNASLESIISVFKKKWDIVTRIRQEVANDAWMDLYYEDFIALPEDYIPELCAFLGTKAPLAYVEDAAGLVNPIPHKSRYEVGWPSETIGLVMDIMSRHPFLAKYAY